VQEADEVLLFVRRQLRTEYEIEEFNRIIKGQQSALMQVVAPSRLRVHLAGTKGATVAS
jgi:hypothetical protein